VKTIFSNGRVTPLRFAAGVTVLALFSAAMIAAAQKGGTLLAVVAGIFFTIPLCSLGEWLVHGVLYHGRVPGFAYIRKIHHAGHHFALFPPERYVQHGAFEFMRVREPLTPFAMSDNPTDNFFSKWGQVALHFVVGVPLIVVPSWYFARELAFTASVFATLALISWLLAYVHGVIHTPRDRMIEHMRWFQWLDRHHYIHHIDLDANINFMMPVCDILFGTEKRTLTAEELARHPSFEAAKPMAKDIPACAPHPDAAIARARA
jgi:hypothetical protein